MRGHARVPVICGRSCWASVSVDAFSKCRRIRSCWASDLLFKGICCENAFFRILFASSSCDQSSKTGWGGYRQESQASGGQRWPLRHNLTLCPLGDDSILIHKTGGSAMARRSAELDGLTQGTCSSEIPITYRDEYSCVPLPHRKGGVWIFGRTQKVSSGAAAPARMVLLRRWSIFIYLGSLP